MSLHNVWCLADDDLHRCIVKEKYERKSTIKDVVPEIIKEYFINKNWLNEDGTLIKTKEV